MKAMGRFDGILGWGVELEIIGGLFDFFFFLFFWGGILYTSMFGWMGGWVALLDRMDGWMRWE